MQMSEGPKNVSEIYRIKVQKFQGSTIYANKIVPEHWKGYE